MNGIRIGMKSGNILFVLESFFASFSKNIIRNIILMVIFSISIVMTVFLSSYYFGLEKRNSDYVGKVGEKIWYCLDLPSADDDFVGSLDTVTGSKSMLEYYDALHSLEQYPIISYDSQQSLTLKEKDVKKIFGEKDYDLFLEPSQKSGVSGFFGKESEGSFLLFLRSAQVDVGAYSFFGLKTQEGVGFFDDTLTIKNPSDAIPVVLGSEYKGILSVGDTFDVDCWEEAYHCKVIGILEKGSAIAVGRTDVGEMHTLDYDILFPYGVKLLNVSNDINEIRRFAILDYTALINGVVQIDEGYGNVRALVETYQDLSEEFDFPPYRVVGSSMGLQIFRRENSIKIKIMLLLTIVTFSFSLYGLFVTFYDEIQSNKNTYGIYIMNGCPLWMIIAPALIEVAVILLPSVIVCKCILTPENVGFDDLKMHLLLVYCLVGALYVLGAVVISIMFKGVDIEQLVRQKE